MAIYMRHYLSALAALTIALSAPVTHAQDFPQDQSQQTAPVLPADPLDDEQMRLSIEEFYARMQKVKKPEAALANLGSLFFSPWQHMLLQEAKEGFKTRIPEPGETGASSSPDAPKDPGLRELSLGGIAYVSATDWTVWLNGQRVKPDALPTEVLDIKVFNEYIELKWFDNYTNLVFPIRMRPHQRFNLDTRIFLPGAKVL